jgi:methionine aminopeptidase
MLYDQHAIESIIEPGMTFTIEPMINLGGIDYEIWCSRCSCAPTPRAHLTRDFRAEEFDVVRQRAHAHPARSVVTAAESCAHW